MLRMRTLGVITIEGDPIRPDLRYTKHTALLLYLASSPRGRSRDGLGELLWPGGKSARSLNQALVSIRGSLGDGEIDTGGGLITLARGAVGLDVEQLVGLSTAHEWSAAAELIEGEFCSGLLVPDAPGFEQWLSTERLRWTQLSTLVLSARAREQLDGGDASGALANARRAAELDPLSEPALAVSLRAMALTGQRSLAVEAYRQFRHRLREAIDAEPSAEIRALVERLSRSEASIAVLPFVSLAADQAWDYFGEGISEQIINALAQVRGLRVAARTSAFVFRHRGLDLTEVGARLNVATVLEGTVQKRGSHLRVTARLVQASDSILIWSESYDREMTDIFAIQDEIARAIAARLDGTFGFRHSGPLITAPTGNLDAYHLYLKGRFHWAQRGRGLEEARRCFSQALNLDPDYAEAHAGLADAWTLLAIHGLARPSDVIPQAREAIRRSLDLAPALADAHCAAGTLKLVFEWDWPGAERDLRRALDLNPRLVAAHYWLAICLGVIGGRHDEALDSIRQAVELDPLSALPQTHLGMVLIAAGRHADAEEPLRQAISLAPDLYVPYLYLGVLLNAIGRAAEAVPLLELAATLSVRAPIALASLAASFGYLGRRQDAEAIHAELNARARREYVQSAVLAIASAVLGRMDESFRLLDQACDERDGVLIYAAAYPAFVALQDDPRMAGIHRRIGLQT